MTRQFDCDRERYRDAVDRSIAFSGAGVDFFAHLKADDLLALLRRRIGSPQDARVLDVGCGPGVTDTYLAPEIGELHGADVSAELVEAATAANPAALYHHYDGATLPFADGFFDATFAICVLHHVDPPERASLVCEMSRVTRSGGIVAVYEHNAYNPLTRVAVARCEFDEGVTLLRPAETAGLLSTAGAPAVESRYIAFFPWQASWLRTIEAHLSWLPLGGQFVVAGSVPPDTP